MEFLHEAQRLTRNWVLRGRELGTVRSDIPEELTIRMVIALDHVRDSWLIEVWDELPTDELQRITNLTLEMTRRWLSPPPEEP